MSLLQKYFDTQSQNLLKLSHKLTYLISKNFCNGDVDVVIEEDNIGFVEGPVFVDDASYSKVHELFTQVILFRIATK